MNRQTSVVVMTRAPRPDQAKTRLQALLGAAGCARLQRALIVRTVAVVADAAQQSLYVAVDPPDPLAEVADIAGPVGEVFAQDGEHPGARMCAATAHAAHLEPGPVVLAGTDVPHLTAGHLLEAARLLQHGHDVVFGPVLDGGYYLVALSRPTPDVFAIDPALWGTASALQDSAASARTAGLRIGFLPPLRDLDSPADAHALSVDDTVPLASRSILSRPVARAHPQPALRPPQPEGPA